VKRVLVVGGTSFIASHTLPRLIASGLEVHATCREQHPDFDGVQWLRGDIAAAGTAETWPSQCDAVIYLAQGRRWREFPGGAADVFDVNVAGVFRALEYARSAGVTHFVFASSGSIYDAGREANRESDGPDLRLSRSFYAASKIAAEALIGGFAPLFKTAVLRLFVPFGPGQSQEMLLPRIADSIKSGRPITLQGDSGLTMNPVAVNDVAEALIRCLSIRESITINVAGPDVVSLREVAERIGRLVGAEPKFDVKPGPAPSIVADTAAIRAHLSWAPPTGIDEGLSRWLQAPRA
jgi:UDP-glucose 4-epimerase